MTISSVTVFIPIAPAPPHSNDTQETTSDRVHSSALSTLEPPPPLSPFNANVEQVFGEELNSDDLPDFLKEDPPQSRRSKSYYKWSSEELFFLEDQLLLQKDLKSIMKVMQDRYPHLNFRQIQNKITALRKQPQQKNSYHKWKPKELERLKELHQRYPNKNRPIIQEMQREYPHLSPGQITPQLYTLKGPSKTRTTCYHRWTPQEQESLEKICSLFPKNVQKVITEMQKEHPHLTDYQIKDKRTSQRSKKKLESD